MYSTQLKFYEFIQKNSLKFLKNRKEKILKFVFTFCENFIFVEI